MQIAAEGIENVDALSEKDLKGEVGVIQSGTPQSEAAHIIGVPFCKKQVIINRKEIKIWKNTVL